jgi:hypothetical protein
MPDTIGRITIPSIVASAAFPLRTSFAHGRARKRSVITHTFGASDAKLEQRFFVGSAATRYDFVRPRLNKVEVDALKNFWDAQQGSFGAFLYDVPLEDQSFVTTTVCFENNPLTIEELVNAAAANITFIEIPDPTAAPAYNIAATVERFPDGTLAAGLQQQVQNVIPLIRIRVINGDVPDIFLSDRRVTVGGQLYLPRLLHIGDPSSEVMISQSIDGSADNVQFSFGNADRVMIQCANDTELKKARIELSFFHMETGYKNDLWAGEIIDWKSDDGPEFVVQASDIISALTLQSPVRNVSRTCWRIYADTNFGCPVDKNADTRDLAHFPNADMASCDLGYDTGNGCLAHVVAIKSFGGAQVDPQQVKILDNSTGTIFGFGRDLITPTSQINDSIWGATLPEIWHNDDGIPQRGIPVNCRLAAGRDESDFYIALGIVGRGPIGAFTVAQMVDTDGDGIAETFIGSTLDGQPHHGFKQTNSTGAFTNSGLGLREVLGTDPAGDTDYFSLGRVGTTPNNFREVVAAGSVYEQNYAAGTSFLEIRRTDQKGVQLSPVSSHQMVAMISQGLTGLTWTAPGTRGTLPGCSNPFWVALNTFLRSLGVDAAVTGTQEAYFDVGSAVACADIADTTVDAIFGGGTEKQFRFKGTLDTLKPLRDQLRDILNNGLGYFTWSFGKLKLGCRTNATPETIFDSGNMLFRSLAIEPLKPQFEKLTIEFADEEYLFQKNTVDYADQDYALRNGRVQNPRASQFGLIGSSTKSQTARIAVIRTREELGGVGLAEQTNARLASWKTTILALDTEAGRVTGIADADIPGGFGAFRIQSWRLNRDWSIDIAAKTVTDSMYDLTTGTLPADVSTAAQPTQAIRDSDVPPPPLFSARVAADDPTSVELFNLSVASTINIRTITAGTFTFYYFDGRVSQPALSSSITDTDTSMDVSSVTGISAGVYAQIGSEAVLCGTPSGLTVPITRGQLGTTAAAHAASATVTLLRSKVVGTSFPFDFFTSAALATWTLRTALPGMTVIAISGFLTNAYGDSDVTTILVNLVLAAPVIAQTNPGGSLTDDWYQQQPIGVRDGVNLDFFLDLIPASPPTGNPPRVPCRLNLNGSGQSAYHPDFLLNPGTNHLQMVKAPKATDWGFEILYKAGGPATGVVAVPPSITGNGGGPGTPPGTTPGPASGLPPVASPEWWFDARFITGVADGAPVTTWNDLSGNGHTATVSAGSATFHANQFNGGAALTLDSCSIAISGAVATTGIFTIFVVFSTSSPSTGAQALLGCSSGSGINYGLIATSGSPRLQYAFSQGGTGFEGYGTAAPDSSWHQVNLAQDASVSLAFRIDGAADAVVGLGGLAAGNPAPDIIGSSNLGGNFVVGQIQLVGYYSRVLTLTEIQQVEAYISTAAPILAGIIFTPAGATFPDALHTVSIAAPAGSTIYFTTDGTTPTTASRIYISPILIPTSLTLKAISVDSTGTVSAVVTSAFVVAPGLPPVPPTPTSSSIHPFWKVGSSSDAFLSQASASDKTFVTSHIYRMMVYPDSIGYGVLAWNPNTWFYRDSSSLYHPGNDSDVNANPSWVYRDSGGRPCYIKYGPQYPDGTYAQYAPDHGDAGFVAWWISQARIQFNAGFRGVWIDDVNLDINLANQTGDVIPIDPRTGAPITAANYQLYLVQFLETVRAAFPGGELCHNALYWNGGGNPSANPTLARQIQACNWYNIERGFDDGGIGGGFGRFNLRTIFDFIDQIHGLGSEFIAEQTPGVSNSDYYPLACFLLVSDGVDMYQVSEGGFPPGWPAINYIDLGAPAGARYDWNGLIRRDFANGIVLIAEPGGFGGGSLGGTFTDPTGNSVSSVNLTSRTGTILHS